MARCPAHDDRTPSLSIREGHDGKLLVHCHAGCEQMRVIEVLRTRRLWPDRTYQDSGLAFRKQAFATSKKAARDDIERAKVALHFWRGTMPAPDTPVEMYLRTRGIRISIPVNLRFHPALKHPAGGNWPAMVALVTRGIDGKAVAIHERSCRGMASARHRLNRKR